MALKGTLKDFGIADIFQLISHQSKTGVLYLTSGDQEVRISFSNGDVVRAESTTRKKADLLGAMLVRAEVLTEEQLAEALETQKRTLKRLGVVLIESGMLALDVLRQFTRLQTTETLYKLFNWETGNYAFETEEVNFDRDTMEPIRSENVLMEGFRMVDEWPMVRRKIHSYEMTFKKVKEPPTKVSADEDAVAAALDDAFSEAPKEKPAKGIGGNEATIWGIVQEGRTVQKLIDLSRLGEFETCKALHNLLAEGYLKVDFAGREGKAAKPGGRMRRFPIGRILVQIVMSAFIAGVIYLLYITLLGSGGLTFLQPTGGKALRDPAAKELLAGMQRKRLEAALQVYHLEEGRFPDSLEDLVRAGLVSDRDLRFPWRNPFVYRRGERDFLLIRPLE